MTQSTLDPVFTSALRTELMQMTRSAAPRKRRLRIGMAAAVLVAGVGGAAAAGLRPVSEVTGTPLAAPMIATGNGSAIVTLPAVPEGARLMHVEIACFRATFCASPGGSVSGPDDGSVKVERSTLTLEQLNTSSAGLELRIGTDAGATWRLYALYLGAEQPPVTQLPDGRTAGQPSKNELPNLLPARSSAGQWGWVEYTSLVGYAPGSGPAMRTLNVYADDGTTVIGTTSVTRAPGS